MIDVDDWENNTDYEGYNKNDITIIYFWKVISTLLYIYIYFFNIIINIFFYNMYIIYI